MKHLNVRHAKYALSMRSMHSWFWTKIRYVCTVVYIRKYLRKYKIEKAIDGQRAVVNLLFC